MSSWWHAIAGKDGTGRLEDWKWKLMLMIFVILLVLCHRQRWNLFRMESVERCVAALVRKYIQRS